jgi:hypothetical protein
MSKNKVTPTQTLQKKKWITFTYHSPLIHKFTSLFIHYVARMPEERAVKNIPEGKSYFGKPNKKLLSDFKNDLRKMVVRG